MTTPPLIALNGVARTYKGPPPTHALKPVQLTIEEGDYVAVIGPSGSGKSTLLNILGLLDRATAGTYSLGGVDINDFNEADLAYLRGSQIGFVFQSFHLMPYRSAVQNIEIGSLYAGRGSRRQRHANAVQLLEKMGLAHRAESPASRLSGGEQQRVAIARALINQPRLLLCDEPTGNLDSENTIGILNLFESLRAEGLTIVVITHDAQVAARADCVHSMKDGLLRPDLAATGRRK
ncbi:ABC transporter ATP-binding protein [Micromonospora sp. BQ11]|uniref:ABC transporter ATP-binding protein n=1 Tax=Micromonospora sp. BQ11 TaxID=3452212 RepID=UPI003F890D0F